MKERIKQKLEKFKKSDWSTRFKMIGFLTLGLSKRLIAYLVGLPTLLILYILRPMINIRIGVLDSLRIGHFLSSADFFLRCQSLERVDEKTRCVFFCRKPVANVQAMTMLKRKMAIAESNFLTSLILIFQRYLPFGPWIKVSTGYDSWGVWAKAKPQLEFTKEEQQKGAELLKSIGIEPGEEYVCFAGRTKEYLEDIEEHLPCKDTVRHDCRDVDINNFLPAMDYLTEQGLKCIRMGSAIRTPLKTDNPNIIDYALNSRSDFGDMYVMAHCKFFVGDTSGIFSMSSAFDKPYVFTNATPLTLAVGRSTHDLFIPKKYQRKQNGDFLSFPEVVNIGIDRFCKTQEFDEKDIEVVENNAEEILGIVREMYQKLNGSWEPQEEDDRLQEVYRSLFAQDHEMRGYTSRVGVEFMRMHRNLFNLVGDRVLQ